MRALELGNRISPITGSLLPCGSLGRLESSLAALASWDSKVGSLDIFQGRCDHSYLP